MPTDEDAVFRFNATLSSSKTYDPALTYPMPAGTFVTNGLVFAVAPTAGAVSIGGEFTEVGPYACRRLVVKRTISPHGRATPKMPTTMRSR